MKSKRGFQLSLNMIIMVVLALVFLGVSIAFIKNMMPKWYNPTSVCDIYPPTDTDSVCVPEELDFKRGKEYKLTVSFFNKEDADIEKTYAPTLTCEGLDLAIASLGQNLPVGETADYMMNIKVPKDAARDTYICSLQLSITTKQIRMVVS